MGVARRALGLGAAASSSAGALSVCAGALLGCGSAQMTERVYDGHHVVGPYVEPEAYSAYARGMYLEEHGDRQGALVAYRRAQASDPDSPAIRTRLGALLCATDREAGLEELLTDGDARDYAPAWAERARCLHSDHRPAEALEAARRAVALAPDNPLANLLIAQLERERARPEAARAWLFAWILRDPNAAAFWRAIDDQGQLLGDASLGALARAGRPRDPGAEPDEYATADSDPLHVALLASASGNSSVAREQAELLLAANPRDGSALILALYAAACSLDEARFAKLLRDSGASQLPRGELVPLMTELIRARVGNDAAEGWSSAYRRVTMSESAR
jgi:tetratricopeptide (TPR) repeat protein